MKRFCSKLYSSRALKVLACLLIATSLLLVIFYQVANHRGARAKELALERLREVGELFTIQELMPVSVPLEENFFGTSALINIVSEGEVGDAARKYLEGLDPKYNHAGTDEEAPARRDRGSASGVSHDLDEWLDYLGGAGGLEILGADTDRAADRLLASLDAAYSELFSELANAVERPHSQLTPNFADRMEGRKLWDSQTVAPTKPIMNLLRLYLIRGAAAAQSGETEIFLECVSVMLRLSEGLRAEPSLLNALVTNAVASYAFSLAWEGINANELDDTALKKIEEQVRDIDLRAVLLQALRGEVLSMIQASESFRDARETAVEGIDSDQWFEHLLVRGLPRGWFDKNCAVLIEWLLDDFIIPCRNFPLDQAFAISEEFEEEMEIYRAEPWADGGSRVLALIAMPAMQLVLSHSLKCEAGRRQLLTACALERFRISSGRYPGALEELVPDYMPILEGDPFLGEGVPMGYRLDGDRYRLWSVSRDMIDDHGESDADVVWRFGGELQSDSIQSTDD